MGELRQSDLEAVLAFLLRCDEFEDLDAFRGGVLPELQRLVPCEIVTYNEIDPVTREVSWVIRPLDPGFLPYGASFARWLHQHPLVEFARRNDDPTPVKLSDFLTPAQFHRLELWERFYRPLSIEHQLAMRLPSRKPQITVHTFNRERSDFSERERELADLLRPHLARAYAHVAARVERRHALAALEKAVDGDGRAVVLLGRSGRIELATPNAERLLRDYGVLASVGGTIPEIIRAWAGDGRAPDPLLIDGPRGQLRIRLVRGTEPGEPDTLLLDDRRSGLPARALSEIGLTKREGEVLDLVAEGRTNAEVAYLLRVSSRTVQKHLEHAYAKLGVTSRGAAVARARELTGAL